MKLNLGRRIILFVHWLASLVLLAICVFPDYARMALSFLDEVPGKYVDIVNIALLTIYLLLSLSVLCMIFKRGSKRADRGFITVDSADTGKVRIAISAIEQMVKQAAYTVDGIADMKISINNSDDAVEISVNVVMVNGSHVPTVTLNMQRAIRQYVEMNCGVAVRSVAINIQSVTASTDGSKRGKRSEVKNAAPSIPVQETAMPSVQPVAPVPVESVVSAETVAREETAEPVYDMVSGVDSDAEVVAPVEADEQETSDAVEELYTEEEKEN